MTDRASIETSTKFGALVLLVALLSLPFLGKAFHIDDTFFLQISQNVLNDPLDPFAGVIDWGGTRRPVWDQASNPPLLSYYLAPFLALGGASEIVLHLAMLPFLALLLWATHALATRFTRSPLLVSGLVMSSSAVVVGLNLMRDVPSTALGLAGVAFVVSGSDRDKRSEVLLGFGLAGLALLTRFNALMFVAVAVLYPLWVGRRKHALGMLIPAAMLLGYSVHNMIVYGEPQLLAQLGRGHNRPFHAWGDNLAAICVVTGSICYLGPLLIVQVLRRPLAAVASATLLASVCGGLFFYLGASADAEYWLWSLVGASLLAAVFTTRPGRDAEARERSDWGFLLTWLTAQLVLIVLVTPYPAVRHLLPALVPLCLLGLRLLESGSRLERAMEAAVVVVIGAQAIVSLAVAVADWELANSYRDLALRSKDDAQGRTAWFVGHWGWLYYAQRAGFEQMHAGGPGPQANDLLVVPQNLDQGVALMRRPELLGSLRSVGRRDYDGISPFRTVSRSGAGFYALFSGRNTERRADVPYRWLPDEPVERFQVYQVTRDPAALD